MQNADWGDRRYPCRREAETGNAGFWMPDRSEIVTQFFTRYLFFSLAVIYFATLKAVSPALFSIEYLLMRARRLFSPQPLFFSSGAAGADIHLYQSKSQQADMAGTTSNHWTLTNEPQAS